MQGAAQNDNPSSAAWCEQFWWANGRLFRCGRKPREEAEPPTVTARLRARPGCTPPSEIDPNVWDHDRFDVLTGVVWRILRIASHVVANPVLWSDEHGYPSIRMVFKTYVHVSTQCSAARIWTGPDVGEDEAPAPNLCSTRTQLPTGRVRSDRDKGADKGAEGGRPAAKRPDLSSDRAWR